MVAGGGTSCLSLELLPLSISMEVVIFRFPDGWRIPDCGVSKGCMLGILAKF